MGTAFLHQFRLQGPWTPLQHGQVLSLIGSIWATPRLAYL